LKRKDTETSESHERAVEQAPSKKKKNAENLEEPSSEGEQLVSIVDNTTPARLPKCRHLAKHIKIEQIQKHVLNPSQWSCKGERFVPF
jgi:hypothetical protein